MTTCSKRQSSVLEQVAKFTALVTVTGWLASTAFAQSDTAGSGTPSTDGQPVFVGESSDETTPEKLPDNAGQSIESAKVAPQVMPMSKPRLTDHESVVGHWGVGFFGNENLQVVPGEQLSLPSLGARYWMTKRLGLEGALGVNISGGSNDSTTGDPASRWGANLHFATPYALAWSKHYTFLVAPEVNFAVGGGKRCDATSTSCTYSNVGGDPKFSAWSFDVGARAGAEVQFGFIGIPELALQGTVGLHLRYQHNKVEQGGGSATASAWQVATSVDKEPWSFFIANIAAIYYF